MLTGKNRDIWLELIETIGEYLMFVFSGAAGGFIVAIMIDEKLWKTFGENTLNIQILLIFFFLILFFILFFLFRLMNKHPEIFLKEFESPISSQNNNDTTARKLE